MDNHCLTLAYWYSNGWRIYKNNLKAILAATLVLYVYRLILLWICYLPHGFTISRLLAIILSPPLWAGFYFFYLKITREKQVRVNDFLSGFTNFFRVWITYFILMLIVFAGTVLLVVPGIIWSIKYGFGIIIILDKKLSPLHAIKLSGRITQGYKLNLFMLFLPLSLLFIFNFLLSIFIHDNENSLLDIVRILSMILYMIGYFIIGPCLSISFTSAYEALCERYEGETREKHPFGVAKNIGSVS